MEANRDSDRLDRFLTDLADPGVLSSLREEERRRRQFLLAGALILGLLVGGGGVLLALHPWRTPPAPEASSVEESVRILVSHGKTLAWSKQLPKAWSELRLATRLAPNMVEGWDALAMSLFFGGQTEEAAQCTRRCLEIEPGYERGYHFLGDISFYSGDYAHAEEYWSKAHASRGLARMRILQGRLQEVAPLVRKLAAERPDDHYLQVELQAVEQGRLTPELRLKLEPGYLLSWNPETARGWRLFYQDRFDEASTVFGAVLAAHPGDGSAMAGKGWSLLKSGNHLDEARPYFERVLARWPANYSALNGLGWCLKEMGQAESALKTWQRLLDLRPDDTVERPEVWKGMGMVYAGKGDYLRAYLYLSNSALKGPDDRETAALLKEVEQKISPPPAP